jgi:hypothetical protein
VLRAASCRPHCESERNERFAPLGSSQGAFFLVTPESKPVMHFLQAPKVPSRIQRWGRASVRVSAGQLLCFGAALFGLSTQPVQALTDEEAYAISAGDNDARIAALQAVLAKGDPALPAFLEALSADTVKVAGNRAYIAYGDDVKDAATGQPAKLPEGAEDVVNNNRMGSEIDAALAAGKLGSKDVTERAAAIDALAKAADESKRRSPTPSLSSSSSWCGPKPC